MKISPERIPLTDRQRTIALAIADLTEGCQATTYSALAERCGYAVKTTAKHFVDQLVALEVCPPIDGKYAAVRLADDILIHDDNLYRIGEPYDGR